MVITVEWDLASQSGIIVSQMSCSLILVGVTKDGDPFCYDDRFTLISANNQELTASLEFAGDNPLEKLHRVSFVEFSFRDRGLLYYSITDFIKMDFHQSLCTITLRIPHQLTQQQHRRFPRMTLTDKLPAQCRIVGLRQKLIHQGTSFPVQIIEISGSGLSFITSANLIYPLYIQFNFELPTLYQTLELNAEIIRINPFGNHSYRAAAEFRNVPEKTQTLLVEYYMGNAKH
jgi:hypothetical protein